MTEPSIELCDAASLAHELTRANVRVDGDPFDITLFPYLLELYDEPAGDVVIRKGAQLGVTAWAILMVIERMKVGTYPRGVLYCFPTEDEVYDFSQSRFDRLLKDNSARYAGVVRATDRAMLKRIGNAMLYFRGTRVSQKGKRPTKLLSIPVDAIFYDEHDDMDPVALDIVKQRTDFSAVNHSFKFGHPSIPEYGVDYDYLQSDQRRWMIRCAACGYYTCLEDEFPGCIGKHKDGTYFRQCRHCGREIHVIDGSWQPLYPEREKRGYWISQLLSARLSLKTIVEDHATVSAQGGEKERRFWNMRLAKPFADLDQILEREFVKSLCDPDRPELEAFPGPSFMGVDVGGKWIHYEIGHKVVNGKFRFHRLGHCETFDELYDIGIKHHVDCAVVDAMAETREVSRFVRRASWAWGCWYEPQLTVYRWDPQTRLVHVGRTWSLDDSHGRTVAGQVSFPRMNVYFENDVVPQLCNLARVKVTDDQTGQTKHVWHIRGVKNDHHRHALNYALIAAERVGLYRQELREQARSAYVSRRHWQAL